MMESWNEDRDVAGRRRFRERPLPAGSLRHLAADRTRYNGSVRQDAKRGTLDACAPNRFTMYDVTM
jgi:hypothetical protein